MVKKSTQCNNGCDSHYETHIKHEGFNIANSYICKSCNQKVVCKQTKIDKLTREIDRYHALACEQWQDVSNKTDAFVVPPENIEIFSQAALMKLMPNQTIILNDTGTRDSMFDILVINETDGHRIAIEITQATNKTRIENIRTFSNKVIEFPASNRRWELLVNSTVKFKIINLKACLLKVEQNFTKNDLINLNLYQSNSLTDYPDLLQMGIESVYATLSEHKTNGEITITLLSSTQINADPVLNLRRLLSQLFTTVKAIDNLNKLKKSCTSERHVFVPITHMPREGYDFSRIKSGTYTVVDINAREWPEEIDAIWAADLSRFIKNGNRAFHAIKIEKIKHGDNILTVRVNEYPLQPYVVVPT